MGTGRCSLVLLTDRSPHRGASALIFPILQQKHPAEREMPKQDMSSSTQSPSAPSLSILKTSVHWAVLITKIIKVPSGLDLSRLILSVNEFSGKQQLNPYGKDGGHEKETSQRYQHQALWSNHAGPPKHPISTGLGCFDPLLLI